MTRVYRDRLLGEVRVPSRAELRASMNLEALQRLEIDVHEVRCACCGLRLTDLSRLKVSASGAIGPECSKHPEAFPCRMSPTKRVRVVRGAEE